MNLADLVVRHAETDPGRTALVFGDQKITYAGYKQLAGRLASALEARGVQRGDRVLYYSRNNPEYFLTYTAAAWIGAVFAPVHHGFKKSELEYVASNAQARIAFVEEQLLEEYLNHTRTVKNLPRDVVVVRPGSHDIASPATVGRPSVADLIAGTDQSPEIADLPGETPVLICYTSGSTSKPKPVLRTHASEVWNAETYHEYWDLRRDDAALMSLPLSWVYGLSTLGQALLAAGSTIYVLTHFNPVNVVKTVTDHRITLFGGTNTMYVKMLDVYDKHGGDLTSLRNCFIGGEPSNPATVARFENLIGSRLWQGYAATEAAPVVLTNPRHDVDAPAGTVGRLVPGAEIKLVDDQGGEVSAGEPGEAYFRCPGSMLEYYREPELTRERVTDDGWFRSGDLVVERDGFYFVVGRKTDMIIRGGSNVAPAEVENALTSVPGVVDAVVFGVPDPEYGEQVAAAITTTADMNLTDEALTATLSQKLASFKIPDRYIRNLTLPEGRTGKRDRRAVRDFVLAPGAV